MNLQFVLCPDFHGATVLALLLNNHSRLSALGDGIPPRKSDVVCACGRQTHECEFWAEVTRRLDAAGHGDRTHLLPIHPALSGIERVDTAVSKLLSLGTLYGHVPLWQLARSAVRHYAAAYVHFYRTVCELHGTDGLVSGSKNLTEVLAQRHFSPGIDRIRVIHLARDPRGFAYSARKHYGWTIADAGRAWVRWHAAFQRLEHYGSDLDYLLVRHEDFCADPVATMARIFSFLGVENEDVCGPPRNPRKHHIVGNNMALTFTGVIAADRSWRDALTADEQREVLERTGQLARTLGYPAAT